MGRSEERAEASAMTGTTNEIMAARKPAKRKGAAARWARRIALGAVAVGIVAAIVTSFMPKPVPVDVEKATRGPMRVTVDEDGRTRVREKYIVASPLLGTLSRIELHPGDEVAQGQVIARLVPMSPPLLDARTRAEAQARVATAQAGLRQAEATIARARTTDELSRAELGRIEALAKNEAASAQQIDRARIEARSRAEEVASAEIGAQVAAQQLRQAEVALAFVSGGKAERAGQADAFEVVSPTGGRILRVVQESGGPVNAGAPLVEIGDPARLEIVVDVLTADAVHVTPGAKVSIERWGGSAALSAHVRNVEPSAFTRVSALGVEEQRVNVVIDLDDPREKVGLARRRLPRRRAHRGVGGRGRAAGAGGRGLPSR